MATRRKTRTRSGRPPVLPPPPGPAAAEDDEPDDEAPRARPTQYIVLFRRRWRDEFREVDRFGTLAEAVSLCRRLGCDDPGVLGEWMIHGPDIYAPPPDPPAPK